MAEVPEMSPRRRTARPQILLCSVKVTDSAGRLRRKRQNGEGQTSMHSEECVSGEGSGLYRMVTLPSAYICKAAVGP